MSKQNTANEIYFANRDLNKGRIIDLIQQRTNSSRAYAGTLFRKAKKVTDDKLRFAKSAVVNDGRRVYIGDYVEFKSDIEQCGKIVDIRGHNLVLENPDGFPGDYLRYATETIETTDRCW